MMHISELKIFFGYVLPSIFSFALAGIYAIVDGYFVGNSLGDLGLSVINISYPIVAVMQALGTGVGMGGAIYYSIFTAKKMNSMAYEFIAGSMWLLLAVSLVTTVGVLYGNKFLLELLGAEGKLLSLGMEYIEVIALGAFLQIVGIGLVPFIRNCGGSFFAMLTMVAGFATNIILDYLFVWVWDWGLVGAAWATVIGQGVTFAVAFVYLLYKNLFTFKITWENLNRVLFSILKLGVAPFGLALSPNVSLVFVNRFSMSYGGEEAVAIYACIAYVTCVVYLILQGVGDGSQPLLSHYYGASNWKSLQKYKHMAYGFGLTLALCGSILIYITKDSLGMVFGTSEFVNGEIGRIMPIFLLSVPFVAVLRITTACFYATEKSFLAYILTFTEPLLLLLFMLILPPLFGGQIMIWWSTVLARVFSAILALALMKLYNE